MESRECYLTAIKPHIYDLPVINADLSAKFRYPANPSCAIAFPVFGHKDDPGVCVFYAISSIYAALSYLHAGDVRENGIPIYFLNGTGSYEVREIYRNAGIPDDLIINFNSDAKYLAQKHQGIFSDVFDPYERLLVIDADTFMFRRQKPEKSDLFARIINDFDPHATDLFLIDCKYRDGSADYRQYHGDYPTPRRSF